MKKNLRILGTRGIPAQHGGFETFAEDLALHLTKRNWEVYVYCQEDGSESVYETEWQGIRLVHIPVHRSGAIGTIIFDWKATVHASKHKDLVLTLGYNTAVFSFLYRLKGIISVMNMDGLEWKRAKWSFSERAWLYINERLGCFFSHHLIADHPEIENHLATRVSRNKITMIPYGADPIDRVDEELLKSYDLSPGQYALVIARPEPENSILEIVTAFSAQQRGINLVVLGHYDANNSVYSKEVLEAASGEVVFLGAVYEKPLVQTLRFFAMVYVHGHQVGGTNPSLVEALAAGNAVLAHDNRFIRWVLGDHALYFTDVLSCEKKFDELTQANTDIARMKKDNARRFHAHFENSLIMSKYEDFLLDVGNLTRVNIQDCNI